MIFYFILLISNVLCLAIHKHHEPVVNQINNEVGSEDDDPEQSKIKLINLIKKIDANSNDQIDESELQKWIEKMQKNYIDNDVKTQWKSFELNYDDNLKWNKFEVKNYGFMSDQINQLNDENDKSIYHTMKSRDELRWKLADQDGDNELSQSEFKCFLHPEECQHMNQLVINETLHDIDKDKDNLISIDEYINDVYSVEHYDGNDPNSVPDWVQREKQNFIEFRDQNKDGHLDRDEIAQWIFGPKDYDNSLAEAKHLISECDENKVNII